MWAKIDDKLHSHRKPRKAGLEAMGLWAVCLSYCGDQLTDGFVPAWYVATWVPGRRGALLAEKLVAAGLWTRAEEEGENGWRFHDYHENNPSREKVLADRQKEAKRKAEQRAAAAAAAAEAELLAAETEMSQQVSHPDTSWDTQRESEGVSEDPDQTRPDQTLRTSSSLGVIGCISDEGANATKSGTLLGEPVGAEIVIDDSVLSPARSEISALFDTGIRHVCSVDDCGKTATVDGEWCGRHAAVTRSRK